MFDNNIPTEVQMQYLRPAQLEERARACPVVYVPFGLIEWHGRQLPLGNDALKAHAILCKSAEIYGGAVFPPQWLSADLASRPQLTQVYAELFGKLKEMGFRVIIAVSGHNIPEQIDMLNQALEPVAAGGGLRHWAGWEVSLSQCAESGTDHAAKWETSNMLFFYPELTDLSALGEVPLAPEMAPPDGIWGEDPRVHASAEVGQRNCELAAKSIGEKAMELLHSLPPEQRGFHLEALSPEYWWEV